MSKPSLSPPADPAGGAEPCAPVAVILLHGRGESAEQMVALSQRVAAPGVAWVALQAPGGAWYPQSFLAPVEDNQPQLDRSLDQIEAEVRTLAQGGWPRDRIVLMGFSQGACLACEYLWRRPGRWGGLVAFTGGLIGPEGTRWPPRPALAGTPVLITNGDADPWVPWARTQATAAALQACGAVVEVMRFSGGEHRVRDAEVEAARGLITPSLAAAAAE